MSLVSLQTSDAEKDQMKRWTLSIMGVVTLVGIGLTVSSAMADHDDRLSVSVAFGRGLNTVRPPGDPLAAVNHAILPHKIKVKQGGVVHFLVGAFFLKRHRQACFSSPLSSPVWSAVFSSRNEF